MESLTSRRWQDQSRLTADQPGTLFVYDCKESNPRGIWPGTKAIQYLAHLAGLEASAREKKLGAWMHSFPAAWHPDIDEVKEVTETPRWASSNGALFVCVGDSQGQLPDNYVMPNGPWQLLAG